MRIEKTSRLPYAAMACATLLALVPWHGADAVSVGEIVSQSKLGEPLQVRVSLLTSPGEQVDDSCLSLAVPDPREDDSSGFLTRASLSIARDGARQYVVISTRRPFNDAFARLRLRIKCPGAGSFTRTLTILPELDMSAMQEQAATPPAEPPPALPALPAAEPARTAPAAQAELAPAPAPPPETRTAASPRPAAKRRHDAPPAPRKTAGTESFRLKLSGEPLDASRIGKISAAERAALLAQQKLLDADDQTASFLALQHQVKQLQDELGQIKLQLAQLGAVPVAPSSSATAAIVAPAVPAQPPRPKPAAPPAPQENSLLPELLSALGLALLVAILWWALRNRETLLERFRRRKPPLAPAPQPSAPTPPLRVIQPPHAPVETPVPPPSSRVEDMDSEKTLNLPPGTAEREAFSEENSMLEEARLYIAHGRPAKSIEILQEIIRHWPQTVDAWSLLLSIYSSLGKVAEFGETAREFLKHHKDTPAWNNIQALGRTLAPDDPLYADQRAAAVRLLTAGQRQQIGDILMGMGALSPQDLQNCLDGYDPAKHGRFGGYLVARKAISLAQLDQALLLQQGISPETQAGELPSLQDMETLLADFDPKRDGSVGKFLASREAAAELLAHAPPASPEPQQAAGRPLFEKHETLDFVLESSAEHPALDLEFEPVAEEKPAEKHQPLDFEVEPAAPSAPAEPAFPEITLNLDFGDSSEKKPAE